MLLGSVVKAKQIWIPSVQMFAKSLLVTGALTCKYCVCQPAQTCPLLRIPAIDDGPGQLRSSRDSRAAGTSPVWTKTDGCRTYACVLSPLSREWKTRDCRFEFWYATYMLHVIEKHEDVYLHFILMFLVYMRFKQKDLICEPQWRGFQTLKRSLWSILKNSTSKSVIS